MEMDFIKCEGLLYRSYIDFVREPFVQGESNALDIRDDLLNDLIAFAFHPNSFKVEFNHNWLISVYGEEQIVKLD